MNELQLGLLAIGAVVVGAVLAFNRWQERKYRRQAEQRFQSSHDDVLLRENAVPARVEPVLDDFPQNEMEPVEEPFMAEELSMQKESAMQEEPLSFSAVDDDEPPIEEPSHPPPQPAQPVSPSQPIPPVATTPEGFSQEPDPETEYIATLSAGDPVSAHALTLVLQQLKSVGKPVRWLGQCNHRQTWGDIAQAAPDTEYVKLAACLQLADRNGPVQGEELNAFCNMAQAVAANLYAVIDCPDKQAALAAAADLDQFCADVDVLIGINVISKDGAPFAGTKLRGLAESAGMKLMPDGMFHYFSDNGEALFSLGNLEPTAFAVDTMKHLSTHGVTFLFDVPKAVGGVQAFNQMLLTVRQFIAPLGALMVDDNRRELSETGIDKIRQQLAPIYEKMASHGTRPGNSRARRLFA